VRGCLLALLVLLGAATVAGASAYLALAVCGCTGR